MLESVDSFLDWSMPLRSNAGAAVPHWVEAGNRTGVENSERTVRFPMMTDYIGAVASAVSAEPGVFYACRSLYIVCPLE